MTADTLWQHYRLAVQKHTRVLPPLTPRWTEAPTLMDLTGMADDDVLTEALERYLSLSNQQRRKLQGCELISLGWFRTCLPALLGDTSKDDEDMAKVRELLK
jgi:hypothetical protein